MNDSNDKPNALLEFFSRPVVVIAASIASIVAIPLSVYFFLASRETPELTYFVHPAKAAVVRTGQTSRLSVQFDGQDLTSDVTATQIAFWNAGRRPIRGSAILSPLVIRTGNKARILEARLQKASRDVVGLTVDSSRLSSGEVEIRWSILEQNDGGVLQIVYAGDEKVEIQAHAILEGQREVVRLDYGRQLSTPGEEYTRSQGWQGQVLANVVVTGGVSMTGMMIWLISRRRKTGQAVAARPMDWVVLTYGPLLIGLGLLMLLLNRPPGPPFGF